MSRKALFLNIFNTREPSETIHLPYLLKDGNVRKYARSRDSMCGSWSVVLRKATMVLRGRKSKTMCGGNNVEKKW